VASTLTFSRDSSLLLLLLGKSEGFFLPFCFLLSNFVEYTLSSLIHPRLAFAQQPDPGFVEDVVALDHRIDLQKLYRPDRT
jgi:hypothetical protein